MCFHITGLLNDIDKSIFSRLRQKEQKWAVWVPGASNMYVQNSKILKSLENIIPL